MRKLLILAALSCGALHLHCDAAAAQEGPIVIRAGTLLDGRGGVQRNVAVTIEGSRITRIGSAQAGRATYDFARGTLLPGLIDTHVHLAGHFGKDGRASTRGETDTEAMLYAFQNAYQTLMAGFTTVQSIGSPSDVELREAIARGLPGPRLLTSISPIDEHTGSPAQIRAFVRNVVGRGADVVKLFASKSIREGGAQTMSDEQIAAACQEAKALGKRTWVHAHSAQAVMAAARAGCFAVTHGSGASDEAMELMVERGTYFEPNIGLVSQNYIENKPRFLGIGNFNEEGFAFMEKGIGIKLEMFRRAMRHKGLKILVGTDAGAGAHGHNVREIVYRVRQAGQAAMEAIVGATSLNAEALGMNDWIGALAPGMEADLLVVDGNPLEDIGALERVVFVMRGGIVYRNVAR